MKKFLTFLMFAGLIAATSCDPKNKEPLTYDMEVELQYEGTSFAQAGIPVELRDLSGSAVFSAETNEGGVAAFKVPAGLYEASASYSMVELTTKYVYNGLNSAIAVTSDAAESRKFIVDLQKSQSSQLIIKELSFSACPKDDGSGVYGNARYVILYNNGETEIDASKISLAFAQPFNSGSSNKFLVDGVLSYESQGWIPAGYAMWWFETNVVIPPYSQILIAINGAIDHSATHSQSVDLSHADYVCYDPESGFNSTTLHPAPSASIPTSNYLQTFRYGMGNAWPLSNLSPAFFIVQHDNIADFTQNSANYDYTSGAKMPDVKIQFEWIVDAIEVFDVSTEAKNNKRLPASIDGGFLNFTTKMGYTTYRNVDKAATEALPENEGKLVYDYAGGTDKVADLTTGSTDPSGIDAEASIANGAHIIYMDTNNSTKDFHMRAKSSLKK